MKFDFSIYFIGNWYLVKIMVNSNKNVPYHDESKIISIQTHKNGMNSINASRLDPSHNLSRLHLDIGLNRERSIDRVILEHPTLELPKTNRSVMWRFDRKRFSENPSGNQIYTLAQF